MSELFAFVIEELKVAHTAPTNGKVDVERHRRVSGPVLECIVIPIRSDGPLAALRTFAVEMVVVLVEIWGVMGFHCDSVVS